MVADGYHRFRCRDNCCCRTDPRLSFGEAMVSEQDETAGRCCFELRDGLAFLFAAVAASIGGDLRVAVASTHWSSVGDRSVVNLGVVD